MKVAEKRALIAAALMSLSSLSAQVSADGDAAAGKAKAGGCAACHGANGVAVITTHPSLAGQNALYLVSALQSYKAKTRSDGQAIIMQAQAARLSVEDMNDLAAYYASLPAGG